VICGRPSPQSTYKAVSYLWEKTIQLPLKCHQCKQVKKIPMRDADKLWSIMRFVRGGATIWLDAMSIDQDDPKDKATQLSIMGDIYRHAQAVSIMLPVSDIEAYSNLKQVGITANAIVKESNCLTSAVQVPESTTIDKRVFNSLAGEFLNQLMEIKNSLERWRYWKRAWTFQEWTVASEIEIACEANKKNECVINIKKVVVNAAHLVSFEMRRAADTVPDDYLERVKRRDDLGRHLHTIKTLFPVEDYIIGGDEVDFSDMRLMTSLPTVNTATSFGTEMLPKTPTGTSHKSLQTLVSLTLNAIHLSKREATYEADLVYCWASMCNICFDYDQNDEYHLALHKVVSSLRHSGITIFNFSVNTDSAETDRNFLKYAVAQQQSNAAYGGHLVGSAMFIGRTDTVSHVQNLLNQDARILHLEPNFNVVLRQVERTIFKRPVLMSNKTRALEVFRSMISGTADGQRLLDVGDMLKTTLGETDDEKLKSHYLITAQIGVEDVYTMWYFNAWAIFPANVLLTDLFIARESLNGTLVLALYGNPKPASTARILAYLNMTHQRDGTYLVKADEQG
ncbi:uncharacterized protein A1O9_08572, partial [Exophiala aquamarina CBS 119918]